MSHPDPATRTYVLDTSVLLSDPGALLRFGDADVVLTVGRRLDFQLAYGSPAVFGGAKFVRLADIPAELRDNRRGAVEVLASPAESLRALVEAAGNRAPALDRAWAAKLRAGHEERARKLRQTMATAPSGGDGRLHPNRVLAALQEAMGEQVERAPLLSGTMSKEGSLVNWRRGKAQGRGQCVL